MTRTSLASGRACTPKRMRWKWFDSSLRRRSAATRAMLVASSCSRTMKRSVGLIAPLAALAPRGSRFVAADFVVAPGRKACPLAPPQHDGARSEFDMQRIKYAGGHPLELVARR
jgi:hypothetical protein